MSLFLSHDNFEMFPSTASRSKRFCVDYVARVLSTPCTLHLDCTFVLLTAKKAVAMVLLLMCLILVALLASPAFAMEVVEPMLVTGVFVKFG